MAKKNETATPASRRKPARRLSSAAVEKKKSATGGQKRTGTAGRKSQKLGKSSRVTPLWQRNLLAAGIVLCFSAFFYFFFIRPYAYRWKPCYGQKGYGVCMPYGYGVHGIDISHYQGEIDWEQLAANRAGRFPLHFVFLKATEGGDYGDDTFAYNFDQARSHGFIRGAYHYFLPQTDARKQADFFIRTVQLSQGDLPPVLDVETTGRKSVAELQAGVRVWLDEVEAYYGVKPILYTSYKFKQRYLSDSIFNTYPYWIAHYYVDSVRYQGTWHFWQHTDVGTVSGIREKVDLNVFNGTLEELRSMTLP